MRRYNLTDKVLGCGHFGRVLLAYSKTDPNRKVAIKILVKEKLGKMLDHIKKEVKIMRTLDHPNIVKYYENYEDETSMFLVMEYCDGVELFDYI